MSLCWNHLNACCHDSHLEKNEIKRATESSPSITETVTDRVYLGDASK
jgi:hypothetical protein